MTYVIAEPCRATRDHSCVDVCPVECIHPTRDERGYDEVDMLFIDPVACIDCDACALACPVGACFEATTLPPEWKHFEDLNARFFAT